MAILSPISVDQLGCEQLPVSALQLVSTGELSQHIIQKISAGFPSPAADYTAEPLDLNKFMIEHPAATFLFTVSGPSMIGAGIHDGDKVAVDRSLNARHGDIVVAVVNNDFTIKWLHKTGGVTELRPDNPEYAPITFKDGEELLIWGVVVGVARRVLYGRRA